MSASHRSPSVRRKRASTGRAARAAFRSTLDASVCRRRAHRQLGCAVEYVECLLLAAHLPEHTSPGPGRGRRVPPVALFLEEADAAAERLVRRVGLAAHRERFAEGAE